MSDEPKPCPFCGSSQIEDVMRTGAIECQDCGGSAPSKFEWNRRVPAPAVPDDVATLARALRYMGGLDALQLIEVRNKAASALEAQAAELARKDAALQRIADGAVDWSHKPADEMQDIARATLTQTTGDTGA